ncbi:MAG: AAA family ATPase [Bacteroidales bacterium]|nr:AAA family ATPase [Bacteroidales bacterium]
MTPSRKLPLGIQTFEELRRKGCLYVDKTDMVWHIANGNKYNYLNRPRRFGKSLLASTLHSYFDGRRDLFEGLKIMEMETDWVSRPVFHFDMSSISSADGFLSYLNRKLSEYEEVYGIVEAEGRASDRFAGIIRRSYQKTEQEVAIIIDEYDSPVRNTLTTADHDATRAHYRDFLSILKSEGSYIHCVFITGISKFTQLSLFSALNTLRNLSFESRYASLCGITNEEIESCLGTEMDVMAKAMGMTYEQLRQRLREYYDGYHFTDDLIDVYNPTSLFTALDDKKIRNYRASDGATLLLPTILSENNIEIEKMDHVVVSRTELETSDYLLSKPAVSLYQMGYLTIKDYDEWNYILGFSNAEVRQTMSDIVLPNVMPELSSSLRVSALGRMAAAMDSGDVDSAMQYISQLVAAAPYDNQRHKVLESHFQFLLSMMFYSVNFSVQQEVRVAAGRIDMVVTTRRWLYVIELKLKSNGGVLAAMEQMQARRYVDAYSAQYRQLCQLAIEFDDDTHCVNRWIHSGFQMG